MIRVLLVLFVASRLAIGQVADDARVVGLIEAYLKPFVETGNFSGAILVARGGKVLFRRGCGMANYELSVPNTPETRFHIASVSKPFTALAILQLQEQGRLSINDPISRFVPFPGGEKITIEHLLTHTSGIPNINDLPDYDTFARSPHKIEELVAKFAGAPLSFSPGSDYRYSNSNYNVLALIVERVSGQSYGEYVRKHILDPAGMRNTGHDGDALQLIPQAASGYQPAGIEGYEKAPYLDWSNKTGNGSLYSTVDDLLLFDRALNSDILLTRSTRDTYFVEGKGNRFGWFQRKRGSHRVMSSNGRSPGFTAQFDRFPAEAVTVIVLSNSYATVSQDPIAPALGAIALGEEAEDPPALRRTSPSASVLSSYEGTYQYGPDYFVPNGKLSISPYPGWLQLALGDFRAPLIPLSDSEFLDRDFLAKVVFVRDAAGNISGLRYVYSGKEYSAKRISGKQGSETLPRSVN